jgi:hypothetical protein
LEHSDQFTYYGIEPKTSGCEIIRTWDTTNPYYCNENPTSSVGSWGPNSYPWFDLTCSRAGNGGSIAAMFDNAALPGNFWGFNTVTSGLGANWNLPGEAARYVDIIFDFRQLRFVNYISNLRFADANIASTDQNAPPELNQITTFSWSVDGLEYTQVAQYTGYKTGLTVNFNKECRYVKIRLENPYSINRGAGYVGLSMLDIYVSEIHYDYDKEYYVYNTDPINTTTWLNINKITVDRYIDHGFADMKFALCDTEEPTLWKYWNAGTSTWLTTSSLTMANAMTIETLLALTEDQLNLLDRGNLRIAAIFKTTDRFKTPVLRNVGFVHDDSSEKCYILSDSNNVQVSFGVDNKMLIVKNATPGDKKLKLVVT